MKESKGMKHPEPIDRKELKTPAVVYRQVLEAVAGVCEASDPVNGKAGGACTTLNS
jgi:hypothetical protein